MADHTKTSKKHAPRGTKKEYVVYTKDGKDYIKKKDASTGKMVYVPVTPKASPAKPASPKASPKRYIFRSKVTFEIGSAGNSSSGSRTELDRYGPAFSAAMGELELDMKNGDLVKHWKGTKDVKSIVPDPNRVKGVIDFVVKTSRTLTEQELNELQKSISHQVHFGWGEDCSDWVSGYTMFIGNPKLVK